MAGLNPQRILVVGDTHGVFNDIVAALDVADEHDIDVLFQVGDFGFFPNLAGHNHFLTAVSEALEDYNKHLWWIDGNHDDHDELTHRNHLRVDRRLTVEGNDRFQHCGRGARWEWNGRTFLACGGAHSIDQEWRVQGVSWWPTEEISQRDIVNCGSEPVDVMFTHDAPAGARNVIYDGHHGFRDRQYPKAHANREAVAHLCDTMQPELLIHGHYHRHNITNYKNTRVEGLNCNNRYGALVILDLNDLSVETVA